MRKKVMFWTQLKAQKREIHYGLILYDVNAMYLHNGLFLTAIKTRATGTPCSKNHKHTQRHTAPYLLHSLTHTHTIKTASDSNC